MLDSWTESGEAIRSSRPYIRELLGDILANTNAKYNAQAT